MKISKVLTLAAGSLLFATVALAADCTQPQKPGNPPDGNTATREEMIASKKAIEKFQADVVSYQDCLTSETEALVAALSKDADPKAAETIAAEQTQKGNAAVDELTAIAAEFKTQLEAFKKRGK